VSLIGGHLIGASLIDVLLTQSIHASQMRKKVVVATIESFRSHKVIR